MKAAGAPALGIVVGLEAEARLLRGRAAEARWQVRCIGPAGPAEAASLELIRSGARALVSFGLAGGLDPFLSPGTVILGRSVIQPGGVEIAADRAWSERLRRRLVPALEPVMGPVAGSDRVMASPLDKAALHRSTGGLAVDMETHGVARAAAAGGVPLLILRAVADCADQAVPEAALVGVSAAGRVRPAAVVRALLERPRQLGELVSVARQARAALDGLRRVVGLAGDDFALL